MDTKSFKPRTWAKLLLIVLLAIVGNSAKAQITELQSPTQAKIHIYIRFTAQPDIVDLALTYRINGTTYSADPSTFERKTILGKDYFVISIYGELDNTSPVKKLKYPIEIQGGTLVTFGGLTWKEGLVGTHGNYNSMKFYGDTFIYVKKGYYRTSAVDLIPTRLDLVEVDTDAEELIMYSYDRSTGLSTMLDTDEDSGEVTVDVDTQTFRHVNEPNAEDPQNPVDYQNYDMSNYPYETKFLLARKSAFSSYQFSIKISYRVVLNEIVVYQNSAGDLLPELNTTNNPDIFYASLANNGNDNAVLYDEFSTSEIGTSETPLNWPTGCTATHSCVVRSYKTNQNDFDGLVGHFRLIIKPREKKWRTEAWLEHKNNNPDGWATFCTPYDVEVPEGLFVLAVTDVIKPEEGGEPGRINMKSMDNYLYIPKETGVLLKGRGTFEFHPWTGETPDRTAYNEGNHMQYVPLTEINSVPFESDGMTHYVFTYDETNEKPLFVKAVPTDRDAGAGWGDTQTTGRIPPFKSYLKIASSDVTGASGTPARELIAVMADEASGITPTTTATGNVSTAVYDLTGRRYDAQSNTLKPGIYVVNGRKYVVR